MRASVLLSLAALSLKAALADWDMQYTTYVVPGTIDGTSTSWSIEYTVRDQGSGTNSLPTPVPYVPPLLTLALSR